jgi:hypothetical protein
MRLTTTATRAVRAAFAVTGAAVAGLGPLLWPGSAGAMIGLGVFVAVNSIRTLATTTTLDDAPLARAAVRAALTEGREIAPHRWRIDGPAAVEIGGELERLQNVWLPGLPGQSGELDRARATMIANEAGPRLAPYLGALSVAEHQAWFATPASARVIDEEPDHRAEYHKDGAEWPSLNTTDPGPTWPVLKDGSQP